MRWLVIVGLLAGWVFLRRNNPKVEAPPAISNNNSEIVVAAGGDVACATWYVKRDTGCKEKETAELLSDATAVLALGDLQYPEGAIWSGFDKSWGRYKDKIYPVPGNHEYQTAGAGKYFDYFGDRAGERGKGYYSFDLGKWHVAAVNSNCEFGACDAETQRQWLQEDLKTNKTMCSLAFMHHPRLASDERIGEYGQPVDELWKIMAEGGVDVVLAGHHHVYERFAPVNGVREFVAGAGGRSLYDFGPVSPGSEVRIKDVFGVLKLTLKEKSYVWKYAGIDGKVYDQGEGQCYN